MTSVVLPKVMLGICNKMDKALVCISFAWCMIRVQHSMPTMLDRCSFKSSCMVTMVSMLTVISMVRTSYVQSGAEHAKVPNECRHAGRAEPLLDVELVFDCNRTTRDLGGLRRPHRELLNKARRKVEVVKKKT